MKYIVFILLLALCSVTHAESYKPAAADTLALGTPLPLTKQMQQLLLQLAVQQSDSTALELVALYLQGARQPGFEPWFHEADHWLSTVSSNVYTSVNYWLLLADIQQQQHQFEAALISLNQVFMQQPKHISASLMAARIYLATAQHQAAQNACARLWQQELFLFSICSYEVAGRKGDWSQSYPALIALYRRQSLLPAQIDLWYRGILAEQAEQLGQISEAKAWLSPVVAAAPTSLWLKWADLSLQLGEASQVYQKLSVKQQSIGLADSLLIRLVVAERQLSEQSSFAAELAQRVEVRLARGDTDHTADLAYYFLKVEPNPQAAVYWAELNYRSAKEPDDFQLLQQSKLALSRLKEISR